MNKHWDQRVAVAEAVEAVRVAADKWVAGCGGYERPAYSSDRRAWFLYVFNPAKSEHGWLNLDTDIVEMSNPYFLER